MTSTGPPLISLHRAPARGRVLGLVMRYEFVRFLLVGGFAALVNLLCAFCYRKVFQGTRYHFEVSVALGFSAGTVISFVLNKFITFRAKDGKTWCQLVRFLLVSMASIAVSTVVAHFVFQALMALSGNTNNSGRVESTAHIFTIGIMTLFNYLAIKHIAFPRKR